MRQILLFFLLSSFFSQAQLVINEGSNANTSFFQQSGSSFPDWLELYNGSSSSINLQGYALSDDLNEPLKWKFPNYSISASDYMIVLANGNGGNGIVNHYETAVYPSDLWQYQIPSGPMVPGWSTVSFASAGWVSGQLGIGYGDGDDVTTVPDPTVSVYARRYFNVTDKSAIRQAFLDLDYDDGFVAYLNGVEIARSGLTGNPPAWNDLATDHEALVYQGGDLTSFEIDTAILFSALTNGVNSLAIEVHNSSAAASGDLTLIPYLTFGFDQPTFYYGGLVYSGFNNGASSFFFQTNFSISSSGETVYLFDPTGMLLDSLNVPDIEPGMSTGKFTDGQPNQVLFMIPTPGSTNNASTSYSGFENEPIIDTLGAFISAPLTVTITNTSVNGGVIRYSLDGQTPTPLSNLYSGPITIGSSTVLRAKCFPTLPGLLASSTATETYLYNEDFTIPVISITTDDVNLYGPQGIFDNFNTDWKKPCEIEYFDADGKKQFSSKASIKPDGGAGGSRSNPQHSVTIEPANNLYGDGVPINYPLIPEKAFINEFYAFYLRNGSNMWNQYPQKDATFMRMMRETNANSQAYSPVVAFVNGEYFGVYELREKANEGYFKTNYGNDMDSLDLLSVSYFYGANDLRTVKGSDTSFYTMVDFVTTADPLSFAYFDKCNSLLDLYNFTDYIAAELWFANFDWIYNNMKIARNRSMDNRWRFFLQDMELGLGVWTDYNANAFDNFRFGNQPNPYWSIYDGLMQNSRFKNYFINRYADLMNTAMRTSVYTPLVDEMYNQLLPEMPRHFQRWTGDVPGGMTTYSNVHNDILNQLGNRNDVVRAQMVNEFSLAETVDVTLAVQPAGAGYIKISTIVPETLPWTGVYFDGNPVKITAVANPGYTFVGWQGNSVIPTALLGNNSLDLNIGNDDTFTAMFNGQPEPLSLTISEINYNADSSRNAGNWIELHNYGTSDLALTNWSVRSKNHWDKFVFADNTSIPAGGYLVVCENVDQFTALHPDVFNFVGGTGFPWSNGRDSIQICNAYGDQVLSAVYEDELPFPACADGWGRTLENIHPDNAVLDSQTWFCGCIAGSPGKAYTPCNEPVYFTEINYNNSNAEYNAGDWVELFNNSQQVLDLSGYVFKDSKDHHVFDLAGITLQPGAYRVLSNDEILFGARHDEVYNFNGTFDFGLGEDDVLRLYNAQGELIESVVYSNVNPWPAQPALEDYTLEYDYTNGYKDPNNANSWFAGCEGGSPGRIYTDCPVLPEGEMGYLYPNPTNSQLMIVFDNANNSTNDTEIEIFDSRGRLIHQFTVHEIESKVGKQISVEDLLGGVYYVKLSQTGRSVQLPFVKF